MIKKLLGNEKEIEIVKRLTGVEDDSRIFVNEVGWTSRIYIIDNGKIVFKFPRNKKFREECRQEVAVLALLKKHKFDVGTPVLNWTTEDNAYFGFYGVEGKPLKDVIHNLNEEQKIDLGTQLGEFLKQLHGITDYGEIKAQTPSEQVEEYLKMYREDRDLLRAFFNESELAAIDDFFAHEVPKCMTGSGELVFCHGDLDYNNTLVNDTNQVGVIDFGDARLYDKSQDFRGMDDETLREAMIKAYGGGEIISRAAAEATSKMIDILNLIYCANNRDLKERDEYIERIRANIMDDGARNE